MRKNNAAGNIEQHKLWGRRFAAMWKLCCCDSGGGGFRRALANELLQQCSWSSGASSSTCVAGPAICTRTEQVQRSHQVLRPTKKKSMY